MPRLLGAGHKKGMTKGKVCPQTATIYMKYESYNFQVLNDINQSINQSINFYWHQNSTFIASMHKNIMWYQTGWLKKGTIPVKYSQPVHRKYVYKINQHTMIVRDRLLLNKKLMWQNEKKIKK